jgi:hypothetical protein
MLSKPSLFIWNYVGFLQKIQFPWRWLSVLSMLGVISFTLSIRRLTIRFPRFERWIVYSGLALIVAMILFDITQIIIPNEPIPRAKFEKIENELETEPIFEGWWPIWAKEEAFENREKVTAGNRLVEIASWESEERAFTVQPGEPLNLRVATFYYPHWKATVNDKSVVVGKDEFGAITIPVHGEVSEVNLSFEEPNINKFAGYISVLTWILFLIVIITYFGKKFFPMLNSGLTTELALSPSQRASGF